MIPIIALLTDFGIRDNYVGVMKGVILTISPDIRFIDISHSIDPFHIQGASYLLYSSWDYVPRGTVFLSVVDPGVGTSRKILIYSCHDRFLVTPDNGTISLLMRMQKTGRSYIVTEKAIGKIRAGHSSTFHGRDIFAPLAAHLALHGLDTIMTTEGNPVILDSMLIKRDLSGKTLTGTILHIDHFGNCITSLHYTDLLNHTIKDSTGKSNEQAIPVSPRKAGRKTEEEPLNKVFGKKLMLMIYTDLQTDTGSPSNISKGSFTQSSTNRSTDGIPDTKIILHGIDRCFSDVPAGHPLAYIGSTGFIEFAIREGNAARSFQLVPGMKVVIAQE